MKLFAAIGAVAVGATGTFLFLHVRRGGRMSLSSFRDTAQDLFGRAKRRARDLKDLEQKAVHEIRQNFAEATDRPLH